MGETVSILGAKGRCGRAAVAAFLDAGWNVRAVARGWDLTEKQPNVNYVECDAKVQLQLENAVAGSDVVVNALNPLYTEWENEVPLLTGAVIGAAKSAGATIIVPGNVYVYGNTMPEVLTEETPHIPTGKLGKIRIEMERAYADAAKGGVQTILLRGGDFIEGVNSGNWFEDQMVAKLPKARFIYPGPLESVHAWAYLPDFARGMVELANIRSTLGPFEDVGFSGFNLTGQQLALHLSDICGQPLKVGKVPWRLMQVLKWFLPVLHGVIEMSYLWRLPHVIDGTKFKRLLPNFQPTLPEDALQEAVTGLFPNLCKET